jgi:flagellar biosynthetic protein FlhB
MAESTGDKTEAPTPRRRQEAREQGNIARSPDLTAAVLLIGTMMLLHYTGGPLVSALRSIVSDSLSSASLADPTLASPLKLFLKFITVAALAIAPLLLGMMALATAANVMQVGFTLNSKKLEPNFEALNPLRGIGKLFKSGSGAVTLVMGLLKMALVGSAAYSAVHGRLHEIVSAQTLGHGAIFVLAAGMVYSISLRIGFILLLLAVIDYAYQRVRIERELRMTKQEVKEEMRRMDGDPLIKQRRRQIAMQIAQKQLKKDVPKADVVITNPTEFAIAIQYDSANMSAPKVVAKGQGYMAARIRQIAIENGVPILERKPLARALFRLVEVGQEIPEQFYSAVAEILAYVYELSGKLKQKQPV